MRMIDIKLDTVCSGRNTHGRMTVGRGKVVEGLGEGRRAIVGTIGLPSPNGKQPIQLVAFLSNSRLRFSGMYKLLIGNNKTSSTSTTTSFFISI